MKTLQCISGLILSSAFVMPVLADDRKDDGFAPMFNGKDLMGWVNVNCAPSTFYAKDGEIITTGRPTGYLRTEKQYENFIAEFDWKHIPPKPGEVGNSGFFVWADPIPAVGTGYTRGIEVQVLVNLTYKNKKGDITATSQGDLFSIWGATCVPDRPHPEGWARCLPSGNFCKGEGEWNHYRVEAKDGRIILEVNGHLVSGLSKCKPRKGYLALESEGSECHFKNLKVKELPSSNPSKDEIADEDQGFKNLYSGLDLSGWQTSDEAKKHWHPRDTVLHYDGTGGELTTEKQFGDAEFVVDFRFPKRDAKSCSIGLRANDALNLTISPDGKLILGGHQGNVSWQGPIKEFEGLKPAGEWNRLHATVRGEGKKLVITINGKKTPDLFSGINDHWPANGAFSLNPTGAMDFANLFVRELK